MGVGRVFTHYGGVFWEGGWACRLSLVYSAADLTMYRTIEGWLDSVQANVNRYDSMGGTL